MSVKLSDQVKWYYNVCFKAAAIYTVGTVACISLCASILYYILGFWSIEDYGLFSFLNLLVQTFLALTIVLVSTLSISDRDVRPILIQIPQQVKFPDIQLTFRAYTRLVIRHRTVVSILTNILFLLCHTTFPLFALSGPFKPSGSDSIQGNQTM